MSLKSKVIEKTIQDHTQNYLQRNKLLYCYQSEFRANHSTDACLSQLTDMILNGAEDGLHTGMILIDFQKATDTSDHKILSNKMKCIGFSDEAIKCFKSYTQSRAFFISLDNVFPETGTTHCGVLQGSILGMLLFLLYTIDIPQALSNHHTYLNADDTSIFHQHRKVMEIENILNKEFSNACRWFVHNKLTIHFGEDKTKRIL